MKNNLYLKIAFAVFVLLAGGCLGGILGIGKASMALAAFCGMYLLYKG